MLTSGNNLLAAARNLHSLDSLHTLASNPDSTSDTEGPPAGGNRCPRAAGSPPHPQRWAGARPAAESCSAPQQSRGPPARSKKSALRDDEDSRPGRGSSSRSAEWQPFCIGPSGSIESNIDELGERRFDRPSTRNSPENLQLVPSGGGSSTSLPGLGTTETHGRAGSWSPGVHGVPPYEDDHRLDYSPFAISATGSDDEERLESFEETEEGVEFELNWTASLEPIAFDRARGPSVEHMQGIPEESMGQNTPRPDSDHSRVKNPFFPPHHHTIVFSTIASTPAHRSTPA